ncbi:FKBP-type peptidyl-prolyl cis-trans isomerase [Microbacterium sp.]|uniref:FKBP-type peptidyl-prolyl cis-trans isomerase n=1 Tax=Microbacterium sp. TaxID=51671 RepID=UPI0028112704|nr:FKBP-type peptidyl-prolyl cis-trans isomerase [Microbacterium sp.]
MRLRPLALLSTVAVAGLLLTGCAGQPDAASTTPGADTKDQCAAAAEPGAVSESVKIEGEFGTASTATFELKQKIEKVQRTVVTEGDGERIGEGDYVSYAVSGFDATTGEKLGDAGYTEGQMLPQNVLANPNLAELIGCATVGSRLAVALPGDQQNSAQVYVVDVLDTVPTAAWGEAKPATEGMPKVTTAENGEPDVAIPNTDAPAELKIAVLKEGDGPAVADGDTTLLQYYGVDWETGESFDSSWSKGEPLALPGNTYVPGFVQALAGQKAGSQVLVVIPPALAYGEDPEAHDLGGKTLVFVIDILATQHAPAQ